MSLLYTQSNSCCLLTQKYTKHHFPCSPHFLSSPLSPALPLLFPLFFLTPLTLSLSLSLLLSLTAQAHSNAAAMEKEVEELSRTVMAGLQDGSLSFRNATKMIVEMGDVSGSCLLVYMKG